jgi:endoglucanase
MSELLHGIELLKNLSLVFGPTGSEEAVADEIIKQLEGTDVEIIRDRMNNVFAIKRANAHPVQTVILSAHMDEVGFIIKDIDGDGYIRFACLGGIDSRVLCGRKVTFRGKEGDVSGVIASKAIHHQSREEREKTTPVKDMFIDIGAASAKEAEQLVSIGDFGTFDSEFYLFGEENAPLIKSKAIDDRLGCAVMLLTMKKIAKGEIKPNVEIDFCFTVREELGLSGAQVVAQKLCPDYAIVL